MPSWELFERRDRAYREQVLPSHVTIRVSVEQAATAPGELGMWGQPGSALAWASDRQRR